MVEMDKRFIQRVDGYGVRAKCWLWQGYVGPNGYGVFPVTTAARPQRVLAHRYAYEVEYGPIPEGLTIDHLCRTRSCVNPLHLEAVSRGTNVLRGIGIAAENARKTSCQHGHPFTPENVYSYRTKSGRVHRQCMTCRRGRFSAYQKANRAKLSGMERNYRHLRSLAREN